MKIRKEIFALAIPNILSNISVPLISSVDTGLMGHLSALHLAAVGSSAMIFNFLYWNFGFLRMGTTGLVAQAYGKQDHQEKSRVFLQALIVALSIASLILVFQKPLAEISFRLMNLDADLQGLAREYFFIRVWDAPSTLVLYIIMAWFFGNQNAFIPLILTLIINLTNIATSYYLVQYAQWGIQGVAFGTLIANYTGILAGCIFIYLKYPLVRIKLSNLRKDLQRFWKLNRDIFLRTVMLSLTFAFLYSMSATFGAIYLAATVVILQFTNWMSYAIDGFAYASESLVGKYIGQQEENQARSVIQKSLIYGFVLAILFSLVYGFFTQPISQLFTSDAEVLQLLDDYRVWIILFPIVGFASYIWDGIFVGLTASIAMRNTMFVSFVVFLFSYFAFKNHWGYTALLAALAAYLLSRGIAQSWVYYRRGLSLK